MWCEYCESCGAATLTKNIWQELGIEILKQGVFGLGSGDDCCGGGHGCDEHVYGFSFGGYGKVVVVLI